MIELTAHQQTALLRWRLILGKRAEGGLNGALNMGNLSSAAGGGDQGCPGLHDRRGKPVSAEMAVGLDQALAFVYEDACAAHAPKGASLEGSSPYLHNNLAHWLRDIRQFFPTDAVTLIQKDAIHRQELKALLFEPETLPLLEKNIDLAATLLHYKDMIPEAARDVARQVVREIVAEIRKRLEHEARQAIIGALRRNQHSVMPVSRNLDWKTI
jgi:hypothetical protein